MPVQQIILVRASASSVFATSNRQDTANRQYSPTIAQIGATVFSCDEMIISPGADQWLCPRACCPTFVDIATDALADAIASYTVSATASPAAKQHSGQ
jgi:hypothetical protein